MKNYSIPLILLTFLFSIWGCSNMGNSSGSTNNRSRLSDRMAQNVLFKWANTDSSGLKLIGIRELPEDNQDIVEFNLFNYTYPANLGGNNHYSGHASAIFSYYNEGYWLLTRVILGSYTDNFATYFTPYLRTDGYIDTSGVSVLAP